MPTPGGPNSSRLVASATKVREASSLTPICTGGRLCLSSMEGWKAKSNCSRVRRKGRWAIRVLVARYRSLRADTSIPSRSASMSGYGICFLAAASSLLSSTSTASVSPRLSMY